MVVQKDSNPPSGTRTDGRALPFLFLLCLFLLDVPQRPPLTRQGPLHPFSPLPLLLYFLPSLKRNTLTVHTETSSSPLPSFPEDARFHRRTRRLCARCPCPGSLYTRLPSDPRIRRGQGARREFYPIRSVYGLSADSSAFCSLLSLAKVLRRVPSRRAVALPSHERILVHRQPPHCCDRFVRPFLSFPVPLLTEGPALRLSPVSVLISLSSDPQSNSDFSNGSTVRPASMDLSTVVRGSLLPISAAATVRLQLHVHR